MSFRTLEITNPTEIHIKNNQLELTQENRQIYIHIEDLKFRTEDLIPFLKGLTVIVRPFIVEFSGSNYVAYILRYAVANNWNSVLQD